MNINQLKNKTILLFGKSRSFSDEEFEKQMKFHSIKVVKEYGEDVVLAVDGRMMTPYEQNMSDSLYEDGKVKTIPIDVLENKLAQEIDEDTLLMSLKLSHDKKRLKSFLQNDMVSDELFLKLIKLYSWGDDDFFESDSNRDVSSAFIARFYKNIQRNHNIQYSTTGFIHLVAQTKVVEILRAISELKPLKFHPKIKQAISMSSYIDERMQKKFFKSGDKEILESLSHNKKLNKSIVKELLNDESLVKNIAKSIELDDELFELLKLFPVPLALNENLTLSMQQKLLNLKSLEVEYALSLNNNIDNSTLKILLESSNENIKEAIYENSSLDTYSIEKAYENGEYLASIAKNETTPIDILYQLQLDARYERFVKTNPSFGKHIQTENIGWLV